jgi:hypothetical protein
MGPTRNAGGGVEMSFAYRAARYVWRWTGRPGIDAIRGTGRVARNVLRKRLGRPDYTRWTSPNGLEEWWDERTALIAKFVPAGAKVIEFGAGRRQLEKLLPAGCTYTPSDLVDRGPGTIVCDLNQRPLPALVHVAPEVGVFGGVLEYVRDVPGVIRWLADAGVKTCVASFDPVPSGLGLVDRYREWVRRYGNGYMNGLTEDGLLRIFEEAGFVCTERQTWARQVLLRLVSRQ